MCDTNWSVQVNCISISRCWPRCYFSNRPEGCGTQTILLAKTMVYDSSTIRNAITYHIWSTRSDDRVACSCIIVCPNTLCLITHGLMFAIHCVVLCSTRFYEHASGSMFNECKQPSCWSHTIVLWWTPMHSCRSKKSMLVQDNSDGPAW